MSETRPVLNWFSETFSSDAKNDDIVKSRSLNITRIAGVIVPVLTGIATAIGEVADKPPFNDVTFQRQLILALVGLIALVTVADIIGRSLANMGESLGGRNKAAVDFAKSITKDDALADLGAGLTKLGSSIAGALRSDVATPLPRALQARHIKKGADVDGHVVAFRGLNGAERTEAGEYLFVAKDAAAVPVWVSAKVLELT